MAIKRFVSTKDNTITTALKADLRTKGTSANMGASDVMEVFSIFGQASTSSIEKARILVEFPVNEIASLVNNKKIPDANVTYKLKLFNSEHSFTTPKQFSLSVSPLIQSWSEGTGLDMESYSDIDASNYLSASVGQLWNDEGGTIPKKENLEATNLDLPVEINQFFDTGLEDLEIDVTKYVDAWKKSYNNQASIASASFLANTAVLTNPGEKIKFISTTGKSTTVEFVAAGTSSLGSTGPSNLVYVSIPAGGLADAVANSVVDAINAHSEFSASINLSVGTNVVSVFQPEASYFGNTITSASQSGVAFRSIVGDPKPIVDLTNSNFKGGTGLPNRGLMIKLSGSFEDGTNSRSYYTKKFFTRTSEFFFKRPIIEAQWDSSKLDDRPDIFKSSSLVPGDENLHNIYLYNNGPFGLVDIPNTQSALVVQLFPAVGPGGNHSAETLVVAGGVAASAPTFITASKVETGIYSAQFAYNGSAKKLYDVWSIVPANFPAASPIQVFTGSALNITERKLNNFYQVPNYVTNITNLKPSYSKNEEATFRVYTRDKNYSPNIYSVATNKASTSKTKKCYYRISRVVDNLKVIDFSTGSSPEYSKLSYDSSGSYFDLDISMLEPNYMYEISLLHKHGSVFSLQPERFKFRVDP